MALRNWLRSRTRNQHQRPASRSRLAVQRLEDRAVPAAGFLSALDVGDATGTGSSQARSVAVDAAGNTHLAGVFSGVTDFDPAHTHAGDADIVTARGANDIFVAKYAPDNTLIWVRRMGGDAAGNDIGEKLEIDGAGNVYVTGRFLDTADFGPITLTSAGDSDGFVAKLSAAGAVQWAKRWGTAAEQDYGKGIDIDAAGNVLVLGVRFDDGHDVFKFSSTGAVVWSCYVDTNKGLTPDLTADAAGNVYVAGYFNGTVDFDPGASTRYVSSGQSYAGFVLKLTSAGKFGWVSPFVSQRVNSTTYGWSAANCVTLDASGNVIVGGYYGSLVDFNPGSGTTTLPTAGGAFVAKLNASGSLVWARALSQSQSTDIVFMYGLATDAAGNVYATGSFTGTVDLDPGAGSYSRRSVRNAADTADSSDLYAVKLTAAGNFAWAETFGGTGSDIGWDIAVGPSGTVYLAGSYQDTVDFDPDPVGTFYLTAPGTKSNLFLVKLSQP